MEPTKDMREYKRYSFEAYIRKVLINKARTLHRLRQVRQKRELTFSELADTDQIECMCGDKYDFEMLSAFELRGEKFVLENFDLYDALSHLSEKYRNVILLSFFLDFSNKEIADYLNVPVSTVSARRNKALEKLRERMKNYEK